MVESRRRRHRLLIVVGVLIFSPSPVIVVI
jgi:hypothetical protein